MPDTVDDWTDISAPPPPVEYGFNALPEHEADAIANDPRFNTALDDPEEVQRFEEWKKKNAPKDSGYNYDLAGAFKAGEVRDDATGHMDDKFKKPNHPTFSEFSNYASLAPDKAGTWEGDTYVPARARATKDANADWVPMSDLDAASVGQPSSDKGGPSTRAGLAGKGDTTGERMADRFYSGPDYNIAMAMALGVGSGTEMVGALMEGWGDEKIVGPLGEKARAAGQTMSQYIASRMDPEWVKAMNKSWVDFSSEGAIRDPKAWIAGFASQVPLIATTLLGGGFATGGLMMAGLERAGILGAQTLGYGAAGAISSAGDAAQSAGADADVAKLTPEQRRKAEGVAGLLGLGVGAATGPTLGKLFHGETGGLTKTLLTGIFEQTVEEGATQAGAEVGKTTVGLDFDWKNVGESMVQGGTLGFGIGSVTGLANRAADKREKASSDAEAAAIQAEIDRIKAEKLQEDEKARGEVGGGVYGPPGPPPPPPAGPGQAGPPVYGPPRPGQGPVDFVAGQDPSTRTPEAREALSQAITAKEAIVLQMGRLAGGLVDLDGKMTVEHDPVKRAKLVGEFQEGKRQLDALKAELSNFPSELPKQGDLPARGAPNFTMPDMEGPQGPPPPPPAGAGPAVPPGPPGSTQAGPEVDPTDGEAYLQAVQALQDAHAAVLATTDPEARHAAVQQFRALRKQVQELHAQLTGTEAPSDPSGTPQQTNPDGTIDADFTVLRDGPPRLTGPIHPTFSADAEGQGELPLGGKRRTPKVIPLKGELHPHDVRTAEERRAIQEAPAEHAARVAELEENLQKQGERIMDLKDGPVRAKAIGIYKDTQRALRDARDTLAQAHEARNSLEGEGQVQPALPGLEEAPQKLKRLSDQLDAKMPPVGLDDTQVGTGGQSTPPIVSVFDEWVKRSQASKAGHATRQAKRAAVEAGAATEEPAPDVQQSLSDTAGDPSDSTDPPVPPANPPLPTSPAQSHRSSSGAELTAIRQAVPVAPPEAPPAPPQAPPVAEAAPAASTLPPAPPAPGSPQAARLEAVRRTTRQTQAEWIETASQLMGTLSAVRRILALPGTLGEWFDGSVVTEKDGTPLRVYHATDTDFERFSNDVLGRRTRAKSAKSGTFFTSSTDVANSYAGELPATGFVGSGLDAKINRAVDKLTGGKFWAFVDWITGGPSEQGTPNIRPVYLRMTNPMEVDYKGQNVLDMKDRRWSRDIARAKAAGHDGFIARNVVDPGFSDDADQHTGDVYVVFDPENIRGVFDVENLPAAPPTSPPSLDAPLTPEERARFFAPPLRKSNSIIARLEAASEEDAPVELPAPPDKLPDPNGYPYATPDESPMADDNAPTPGVLEAGHTLGGEPTPRTQMEPRNILARLLGKGAPVGVNEVLSRLASQMELTPALEKLLQKLAASFPATATRPSTVKIENRALTDGFQGIYDPSSDTIYIDLAQAEDPFTAVLHEMVHAAIIVRSRTNPVFQKNLGSLTARAKEYWEGQGRADHPAFANIEEFIAYALTDNAFQKQLAGLHPTTSGDSQPSMWATLKRRVATALNFQPGLPEANLFDQLLEFIPDAGFLQDVENRTAVLAELSRLGLNQANALFSTYVAALKGSTAMPVDFSRLTGRVWHWQARLLSQQQIAQSYGHIGSSPGLHDVINRHERYRNQAQAYASKRKQIASHVVEAFKNAASTDPTGKMADLMVDSRMAALDPSLASSHADNLAGMAMPGGLSAYNDLVTQWAALTPNQQNTYKLVRDSALAIYHDDVNGKMLATVRAMTTPQIADQLEVIINKRPPVVSAAGAAMGVDLSWQPALTLPEIITHVNNLIVTSPVAMTGAEQIIMATAVIKQLSAVQALVQKTPGPYFPLRRYGDYMVVLKTPEIVQPMSQAALDAMIDADRRHPDGDLGGIQVTDQKVLPGGMIQVTYRHILVEAHTKENAASEAFARQRDKWVTAGRTVDPKSSPSLKRDQTFDALGLNPEVVDNLRKHVEAAMGPGSGAMASAAILDYALEKMPDTSVKKSRMKANRIAGASHDMMRAYAEYAQGKAYSQAQMRFGHRMSRALNLDLKADSDTLRQSGRMQQAFDLDFLGNLLNGRSTITNESAARPEGGLVSKSMAKAPALAAVYLLTGFGTVITNLLQPFAWTLPYLSARYGLMRTGAAMVRAYADLIPKSLKELKAEYKRVKPAFSKAIRGRTDAPSIHNPQASFVDQMTAGLNPEEQKFMDRLAQANKLDYGIVADIRSVAQGQGKFWNAFNFVTDVAFILPQMVETLNRTVTALAHYRLQKSDMARSGTSLAYTNLDELDDPGTPAGAMFDTMLQSSALAIDNTQFDYSHANKPPIMQKESLRMAMTFKTFTTSALYVIGHNIAQMVHSNDPAGRARAGAFIGALAGTTMISSGAMGIVGLDFIYWPMVALMALFGSKDKDPEELLRHAMADWNQTLANTLLKGIPYGLANMDTSRMGMNSVLPVREIMDWYKDPTKLGAVGAVGAATAGVPFSLGSDIVDGIGEMLDGNINKGLAKATPKAFQINDAVRAFGYVSHGVQDSQGLTRIKPEEIGITGAITRALGFTPSGITEANSMQSAWYQKRAAAKQDHDGILSDFATAALNDGDVDQAIDDAVAFNEEHPLQMITKKALLGAVKRRLQRADELEAFGVPARTKADRALAMELDPEYAASGGF